MSLARKAVSNGLKLAIPRMSSRYMKRKYASLSPGNRPSVCIIGAGFAGICAGIKLQTDLGLTNFKIFERLPDVGGTWMANNYPGCACDIPTHLYSYSFEPKPEWTRAYATHDELQRYIQDTCRKYDLYNYAQFNSTVNKVEWDKSRKQWLVIYSNRGGNILQQYFDVVICANGILRDPHFPPEFLSYKKPIFHSSEWNRSISLSAIDTVGVVGTGSTGIQIIEALAPRVKELHVFQRNAPYVIAPTYKDVSPLFQMAYERFPPLLLLHRWRLFLHYEIMANAFRPNSLMGKAIKKHITFHRNREIPEHNEVLREQMTPKYDFGCKRVVFGSSFYRAVQRHNVFVHTRPIKAVESYGIVVGGVDGAPTERYGFDYLILATGFNIKEFHAPMKIIGESGQDIMEKWHNDQPSNYLGMVNSDMPNLFDLVGPYSFLGHNSILFMIECQVDYTVKMLKEMIKRNQKIIRVKEEVEHAHMQEIKQALRNTTFAQGCSNWYKNDKGNIIVLWPYSCFTYWMKTAFPNKNDFIFES